MDDCIQGSVVPIDALDGRVNQFQRRNLPLRYQSRESETVVLSIFFEAHLPSAGLQ